MDYDVVSTEDVPVIDHSTNPDLVVDLACRDVGSALGTEELAVQLWYFEEGDEMGYHAHTDQEELFYVLDGVFSLKLGRSGETEIVEATEGTFWRVSKLIGRGHRCISEDGGSILAIGAPNLPDPDVDPHSLSDDDIAEGE